METDDQKATKLAELKSKIEEIAGRKIDASAEQLLFGLWPISASTYLAVHEKYVNETWVTNEQLINPVPICTDSSLLDTSGVVVTGANGTIVFRLRGFTCPSKRNFIFSEPVNLLATSQGAIPRYVTMTHELIHPLQPESSDVQITAFSWNPDGTAAPNVAYPVVPGSSKCGIAA